MSDAQRSSAWLSRPAMGVLVIVGLVLLLQIPIALLRGLIEERVATRDEALTEVAATWGGAQSIVGPRLAVPYRRSGMEGEPDEGVASFLPASLSIVGEVEARPLTRGLFTVPVYHAALVVRGRFDPPAELGPLGLAPDELMWDEASLVIELTDPRAVGAQSTLSWQGEDVPLLPGTNDGQQHRGVHGVLPTAADRPSDFELTLSLRGSSSIWFVPFARETRVQLGSNWRHPSFGGAWLPEQRDVHADGFSAAWSVPFLGRDYAQVWTAADAPNDRIEASRFGADLISPVDPYRMSERSTKYAPLFLTFTFGLLWLFDTLTGVRVHPIQYLLIGGAVCLFYLLELSLGEHVGFVGAYAIAACAVMGLTALYTKAVLASTARGAMVGGAMGGLYAYLLALLSLERYALLAGSLGLFAALAVVMYLTRWIDWDQLVRTGPANVG